jgi:hypothetical protein
MPARGMILTVLFTFVTVADKIHDGTPGRDGSGNHQLEVEEEKEGEEMGDEVIGKGEKADGGIFTRTQTAHGRGHGLGQEDQDGRRDVRVRRNPNTDREREWRRGFEKFEPKTAKSSRKKDMPRILTEKSGQPPSKYGNCNQ